MQDETLLRLIPIGEENAVTAQWIWKEQNHVSRMGEMMKQLNVFIRNGLAERKLVRPQKSGIEVVYFRKADR